MAAQRGRHDPGPQPPLAPPCRSAAPCSAPGNDKQPLLRLPCTRRTASARSSTRAPATAMISAGKAHRAGGLFSTGPGAQGPAQAADIETRAADRTGISPSPPLLRSLGMPDHGPASRAPREDDAPGTAQPAPTPPRRRPAAPRRHGAGVSRRRQGGPDHVTTLRRHCQPAPATRGPDRQGQLQPAGNRRLKTEVPGSIERPGHRRRTARDQGYAPPSRSMPSPAKRCGCMRGRGAPRNGAGRGAGLRGQRRRHDSGRHHRRRSTRRPRERRGGSARGRPADRATGSPVEVVGGCARAGRRTAHAAHGAALPARAAAAGSSTPFLSAVSSGSTPG